MCVIIIDRNCMGSNCTGYTIRLCTIYILNLSTVIVTFIIFSAALPGKNLTYTIAVSTAVSRLCREVLPLHTCIEDGSKVIFRNAVQIYLISYNI